MFFVLLRIIAVAFVLTQPAPFKPNMLVDIKSGDNTGWPGKEKPRICFGS